MYLNFFIRAGRAGFREDFPRLHMGVRMRSNDVIKGLTYDMPLFLKIQWEMLEALRSRASDYNDLPKNLHMGSYHHHADSMHLYQQDYALAKAILNPALREKWEKDNG